MTKDSNRQYVLGMFPYPSGEGLHVGHVRIYTAVDVMARYFRLKGARVMCPIGWDAFGLPAENAAIKAKTNPKKIVPRNYANFRKQMQNLSFAFDWERELATTDPSYYGLTQWIFLELYKKGLVYREQVPINWCPKCKTGLANEEVLADGTHERCGTATGKKELPQWVMAITKYAERLLVDLDQDLGEWYGTKLSARQHVSTSAREQRGSVETWKREDAAKSLDWPRGILEMQRNWIGRDKGLDIDFELSNGETVTVWTKYWETVFGTTFLVVAPEVAQGWMKGGWQASKEVEQYVERAVQRTDLARQEGTREKTGVKTDLVAVNKVNGKQVPVYVADYVLASVGTGAVMGVPAHDERDFAFAKKQELPIVQVVSYADKGLDEQVRRAERSFEGEGKLVNSGEFDGMEAWGEGKERMAEWMIAKGMGRWRVNYHLRDWVFSRQRYWGEPIPLVYCAPCAQKDVRKQDDSEKSGKKLQIVKQNGKEYAVVPLAEKDLPLELPDLESYEPTETGESPLSRVEEWVKVSCPNCGGEARRETDTMPNWAGSCWYHLAFSFWRIQDKRKQDTSEKSTKEILEGYKKKSEKPFSDFWREYAKVKIEEWLPVDWYLGGAEHAVLHLLYARFWNKVLYDLGHLSFPEPYLRLRSVGMVLAEDGRKMSKSWGNVINPDEVVAQYGSDAVRLYEMFMGPWDQATAWDSRALVGQQRFLQRVVSTFEDKERRGDKTSPQLAVQLSSLIKQVERGVVGQKFNTCIAGMMELVNSWRNRKLSMSPEDGRKLAAVMSPFAPKTAQKVWEKCGGEGQVEESEWPSLEAREIGVPVTIAVQVNGKLRTTIQVSPSTAENESEVMKVVMAEERVKKWIPKSGVKKAIFVPGRLVNLVV